MPIQLTPLNEWISQKIGSGRNFSPEALAAYQLQKLQETLDLTRQKSPFYRQRLAGCPQKLTRLEELAEFPFTTAQDIREQGLQMLCVSQDEIQRVVTLDTTGTSGEPKRIFFTPADQELTVDFFHIGMSTFTVPGDRVLILLPCERPGSVGDLLATGLERMGAIPIKHGVVKEPNSTLKLIREQRVNVIVGIPVQVLGLARLSEGLKLKSVLLSTDHVPDAIVTGIESKWQCRVFNHYGMTEMGLGGGVECEAHRGYHLREADLYFEVIDPQSGQPLKEGETGEVVFTTLTRQGMPLIRYRTGDLSRFLPGTCPCGTNLKTLAKIKTRIDGLVHLENGSTLTLADLEEALFSVDGVLNFTATLTQKQKPWELTISIFTPSVQRKNMVDRVLKNLFTHPLLKQAVDDQVIIFKVSLADKAGSENQTTKRTLKVIHD